MGHGFFTRYVTTMASGGTLTGQVDLGRAFAKVYLEVPSMTSNTQLHIQAAAEQGGTFRRVKQWNVASANVSADFAIASSVSGGALVPIPPGLQYVKVEATATVDNGATFKIICSDC